MNQLSIITQMFEKLSDTEKLDFLEYLKGKPSKETNAFASFDELILKHNHAIRPDRPKCAHCDSDNVVKNGHKDGLQRYLCKDCGKTFAITNNTILFSSKKSVDVWQKFCECIMNKCSIRKSAEICGINTHTAFNWRHKILDALQNMQDEVVLSGVIESDETFFPVSFKGGHKNFQLPREAHKRGHSVATRGLSKEMVCVPCSVNLNGMSVGRISNLGRPSLRNLESVLNGILDSGSILVTDSLRIYQKIAHDNDVTHIKIEKGKHKSGAFNIQTINAYHSELKRMVVGNFKGVSTKYLNNYIVYHNFVNFAKDSYANKLNILEDYVFTTDCKTRGYNIAERKAIPVME